MRGWGFALTQNSLMDEGEYLLKGHLFVTGVYWPFEDYGLWTNHMPLSFLIPGFVQHLFGLGLRTGRVYALVLLALSLLGLWIVARRFGSSSRGRWLAASAIWAIALNTAALKMYSTATSQVLISCMLVWTLVLVLGEARPTWQVVLGGALSGVILLTRLNLAPVLPLVLAYIFWQHGQKTGWMAGTAALLVVGIGHAIFWPGILRMWAAWAPVALTPFLADWRPPSGLPAWNPTLGFSSRVLSFLYGLRYHFVAVGGMALVLLLWPRRAAWRRESHFKAAVFLAASFLVLMLAHAWASLGVHGQTNEALGNDYCVFCFPVYLSFFSINGLLLLVIFLSAGPGGGTAWRGFLLGGAVLAMGAAAGYGAYNELGPWMVRWRVPRLRTLLTTGEWLPGEVPLWEFMQVQVGIDYNLSKRLLPAVLGLAAAGALLVIAWAIFHWSRRREMPHTTFGLIGLVVFVLAGMLLSPTTALGAGYDNYDCGGNVIASYERTGAHLAEWIPAGQRIYWQGSLSSAPLLYLERPILLPGQINQRYTLRLSGDEQAHQRFGFWTQALAEAWLQQSDYAIVSERNLVGWLAEALQDTSQFTELPAAPALVACDPDSALRIFLNNRPQGSSRPLGSGSSRSLI